ncbi:MAG TPA: tyrosine-type recombinase/integrase [Dehalococcoidia bacterium]|nr:tyrosine-type recombinase/integrase [Dehalococcoidia bacterium]
MFRDSLYLFFPRRCDTNKEYLDRCVIADRLSKFCKIAKITPISPHQLRHYFATHTLSNGADVKAVSEMLGHADVGITLRVYHHVNARAIREMHRECSPISAI